MLVCWFFSLFIVVKQFIKLHTDEENMYMMQNTYIYIYNIEYVYVHKHINTYIYIENRNIHPNKNFMNM